MSHYVRVRQDYLVSPNHSSTAQACTVLVTGIPPKYLSEAVLTRLFDHLPGGVRKVWINRNLGDMPDLYERRLAACDMLESAETSLLNKAIKRNNKHHKKVTSSAVAELTEPEKDTEAARKTSIAELVPSGKRPSHRLPLFSWMPFSIPFVGKKVDTIEWARDQVRELNAQLKQKREVLASDIAKATAAEIQTTDRVHRIGAGRLNIAIPAVSVTLPLVGALSVVDFSDQTYPPANGAFILFNKQIAAHMAAQTLTHHDPYRMSDSLKYVEVGPGDVIWDNLTLNAYERRVRLALSWAATIGLIIFFALPGQSVVSEFEDAMGLTGHLSHVGRIHFEHPCPMYDIPLAFVGLQSPGCNCQLRPGFRLCGAACGNRLFSTDTYADAGTF
jgi:calcium permeable stress-gated cation channel